MALYRCKRDTWELRQEGHHLVWSQLGADILDDSNFLGDLCMSLNMWVNVGSIDFGVTNSSEQTKLQIWNPWIRVDCVCIYVYIYTYICVYEYTHTHTHIYIPLEKAMATHSSTLAWKSPWTEEPGRLQSMGSQRVGHDWATSLFTFIHWRRKWQPTPVFLPGESQGRGSLVGCQNLFKILWLSKSFSVFLFSTKYFSELPLHLPKAMTGSNPRFYPQLWM